MFASFVRLAKGRPSLTSETPCEPQAQDAERIYLTTVGVNCADSGRLALRGGDQRPIRRRGRRAQLRSEDDHRLGRAGTGAGGRRAPSGTGLIHHSDRSPQYCSHEYQAWTFERLQIRAKSETPAPVKVQAFARLVAEPTGLEPATSDVTGRRSNQLNYDSAWEPEFSNAPRAPVNW